MPPLSLALGGAWLQMTGALHINRKLDLACCARHKGCALFHIIIIIIIIIINAITVSIKTSFIGKWRKSEFWPRVYRMLMKDSTAVSNKWCMPINFLCGAVLFDPWFTQNKVKGHLVQIFKEKQTNNKIIEIMTRKSDKNQLELGKGVGLRHKIYIHFI